MEIFQRCHLSVQGARRSSFLLHALASSRPRWKPDTSALHQIHKSSCLRASPLPARERKREHKVETLVRKILHFCTGCILGTYRAGVLSGSGRAGLCTSGSGRAGLCTSGSGRAGPEKVGLGPGSGQYNKTPAFFKKKSKKSVPNIGIFQPSVV